jgi:hypothetical protein
MSSASVDYVVGQIRKEYDPGLERLAPRSGSGNINCQPKQLPPVPSLASSWFPNAPHYRWDTLTEEQAAENDAHKNVTAFRTAKAKLLAEKDDTNSLSPEARERLLSSLRFQVAIRRPAAILAVNYYSSIAAEESRELNRLRGQARETKSSEAEDADYECYGAYMQTNLPYAYTSKSSLNEAIQTYRAAARSAVLQWIDALADAVFRGDVRETKECNKGLENARKRFEHAALACAPERADETGFWRVN